MILSGAYSCKKGENDPFLSLSSRKARLTGEWKLSSENSTRTNTNSTGTSTTVRTFDGTTSSYSYTSASGITSTSTMNEDITFEKDGTFTFVRTETQDGETYTMTGTGNWAFIGKSKTAELKNKEAISLSFTKFTDSDGYFEEYAGTHLNYSSLIIEQLKSKEIVFSFDDAGTSVNTSPSGAWNNSWTGKGTTTYTKK